MKRIKLVVDRVEIVSVDASAMKGIHNFNIYIYAGQFMEEHGYAGKLAYDIDMENYIIHIYTINMREVEL